jgi:hypothetical protein
MSRQLPAKRPTARPEVVVLDVDVDAQRGGARGAGALARTALELTPDVLRLVERSVAARQRPVAAPHAQPVDNRVYTEGLRFTEERHESRLPWARNVTVRTATSWRTSAPAVVAPETEPDTVARLRRAGLLGVGGAAALAACGLLLNRGLSAAVGGRRLRRGGR